MEIRCANGYSVITGIRIQTREVVVMAKMVPTGMDF